MSNDGRRLLAPMLLALGAASAIAAEEPQPAPRCDGTWFTTYSCGTCANAMGSGSCTLATFNWCGNGSLMGEARWTAWGCSPSVDGTDTSSWACPGGVGQSEDSCSPGVQSDNNADGCKGGGCSLGSEPCACKGGCSSATCPAVPATCSPSSWATETCDGQDDNCDGQADEGCGGTKSLLAGELDREDEAACLGSAGADPIALSLAAAITEPFDDLRIEGGLSFTRTYQSAAASVRLLAPPGPLGRGWTSDWEATLTCLDEVAWRDPRNPEYTTTRKVCIVRRGAGVTTRFVLGGAFSGGELWEPYRTAVLQERAREQLLRWTDGSWSLFAQDGRELRFRSHCGACGGVACADPLAGGVARLSAAVDDVGQVTDVSEDRPAGVLLKVTDPFGHALELRSAASCSAELARELRYDGALIATYHFVGQELREVRDASGQATRSYHYLPGWEGLLVAVLDEAGAPVVEFSYDGAGKAVGVSDARSSVLVSYGTGSATVTEFHGTTSSTSTRHFNQQGAVVQVTEGCACSPPRTLSWSEGRLVCSVDELGLVSFLERDADGELIRSRQYTGLSCPYTAPSLPAPSRETWLDGVDFLRPVAGGFSIRVRRLVTSSKRSSPSTSGYTAETLDRDPTPQAIDPPGYACQASPLPAGSVVCRHIVSGFGTSAAGTLPDRLATFNSFDARGRLIRRVGPVSLDRATVDDVVPVEERVYWSDVETPNRRGRLREVKAWAGPDAPPMVSTFDHDAFGVARVTDPAGAVTTVERDLRGRPRRITSPTGVTELRYHAGVDPRLVLLPDGSVLRSGYDRKGRRTSLELLDSDPDLSGSTPRVAWTQSTTYDAAGNPVLVERRDAGGVRFRRERTFDVRHKVLTDSDGDVTVNRDERGDVDSLVDGVGRVTTLGRDALGRVSTVRRSLMGGSALDAAGYTYQARGEGIATVKDGRGGITNYKVDDFGRVTQVQSSNFVAGPSWLTWDARGNLVQRKDNQVTVNMKYDGLDRVLQLSGYNAVDKATATHDFTYDEGGETGRLTSMTDGQRRLSFAYDGAGRLDGEALRDGGSPPLEVGYLYFADGELQRITYPSGMQIEYLRQGPGLPVAAVRDSASGALLASGIVRVAGGPVEELSFGNGLNLAQAFDLEGHATSVASGPVALAWQHDAAGDVAEITEAGVASATQHDLFGRLTAIGTSQSYGYDGNGNRTTQALAGTTREYTLVGDKVTAAHDVVGTARTPRNAFAHDALSAVSEVGKYTGSSITSAMCLRHDPLGRLVLVGRRSSWLSSGCSLDSHVSEVTARFRYDGLGRRIARQEPATGVWTYFMHDPSGRLLAEATLGAGGWTPVREYVWLGGMPLAQVEYAGGVPRVYYLHVDHLGLPRAMTNAAGQAVWSAEARPYGDLVETTAPDPLSGRTVVTNLRLPGQYDERLLASVGLQGPYYNWHRWYLPSMGRYMEPDPIALHGRFNGPHGPNWYGYAEGNPLVWVDPNALDAIHFLRQSRNLIWFNDAGDPIAWYQAMSGPFGNGPLPDGYYIGSNLRQSRKTQGMVCGRDTADEVGYSIDLAPAFSTQRDLLRIHPRGGNGTLGCIGVYCQDATAFLDALKDYFITRGKNNIPVWVFP